MRNLGAWWGATVGAMVVYTSSVFASVPPPLYYFPRLGSLSFIAIPGEPAIRWFGWLLYATVGGLIGFMIGRLTHRRPPWALIGMMGMLAMLLLVWHERHWFLK